MKPRVSPMRISSLLRAAGLGLALFTGACSTFPGAEADIGETATTTIVAEIPTSPAAPPDLTKDDLGLGKMHFAKGHYGLAEMHFRRAVEAAPGQAEGWLGLAASYDQLKRWDLADRAYAQALKLTGPTPAVLNNRGYSYLLRGRPQAREPGPLGRRRAGSRERADPVQSAGARRQGAQARLTSACRTLVEGRNRFTSRHVNAAVYPGGAAPARDDIEVPRRWHMALGPSALDATASGSDPSAGPEGRGRGRCAGISFGCRTGTSVGV